MLVVYATGPERASEIVMTVFAGIAEYERSIIVERPGRRCEAALRCGVEFGPGIRITSQQMETARDRLDKGYTVDQSSEVIVLNRSSVYRLVIHE